MTDAVSVCLIFAFFLATVGLMWIADRLMR